MDKKEPIELISQIKAIFYFIGGSYIHFNDDEEEHDISVIKVNIKDCNTKEDCVTLPLIEERINNIQGVDYNLKLIISKVLPKILVENRKIQCRFLGNKNYVYIEFEELMKSLRNECELLEVE